MNEENSKDEVTKTPEKSKSKRNKIIVAVVGVVVTCCCLVFVIPAANDSAEDGEPTATVEVQEQEVISEEAAVGEIEEVAEVEPTNTLPPASTPEPTNTVISTATAPTNTPVPPTTAPVPTNTPEWVGDSSDGYLSGGLGLSRSDWEQIHTETELGYGIGTGYDDKYDVLFQVGNVWVLSRYWDHDFVTLDVVEIETRNLIPSDSEFVKTYSPEGFPETILTMLH